MSSVRRPGINLNGMAVAGQALNPGFIFINDCTRDEQQRIGELRGKLTLAPIPSGRFHVYFDEEIELNNPSFDMVKIYQLDYYAPNGEFLGSSQPVELAPSGKREIPSPHTV